MKHKKEVIDQSSHVVVAILVFILFTLGGYFGALLAGFIMGMIREVTEEGATVDVDKLLSAIKSWKDLLFWSIGGLLAKLITEGILIYA